MTQSDEIRFWNKVHRAGPEDCWIWTAGRFSFGHGCFRVDKKVRLAHRIAWQLAYGEIPEGAIICHTCDNAPCCNPGHLQAGNHSLNLLQCCARGRRSRKKTPHLFCPHRPRVILSVEERMLQRVDRSDPDACWEWLAGKNDTGYGQIGIDGIVRKAHRVAWEMANGAIPPGLFVCHHCDNPGCCNPAHLFLGTNADNVRDRQQKGRTRSGSCPLEMHARAERHGRAKLAWSDIRAIRAAASTANAQLAREYGVSKTHIRAIKSGRLWRDPTYSGLAGAGEASGERNGHAKLTWEKVRALRAEPKGQPLCVLAAGYGVSKSAISMILQGKTWKEHSI